jgi:radical SAM superfamily enzyme with C-terminal helix-hairpin-helix motif
MNVKNVKIICYVPRDVLLSRINVRIMEQPMAKICQETRKVPKKDPRISSGIKGLKRANQPDNSADTPMLNKIIPQTINLIDVFVSKNPANMMKKKPAMVRIIPDVPIFFLPYRSA